MLILRCLFQQASMILASRDKRLEYLPFTSPESIPIIIAFYLLFVFKLGPKFMEHRKPFNIDRCLLLYNGLQVFCNAGILLYGWYVINTVIEYKMNFMCEPLDFSDSLVGLYSAHFVYYYTVVKIFDLSDTIFFVLRKKSQQISFLHVYHHVGILFAAWVAVQWAPGGQPWLFGFLNSFVHTIMYSYYFGSVYYPKLKSNIFVKKSITQMQIIQFILSICHLSMPLFDGECSYPKILLIIAVLQYLVMLLMFCDFYYSAYIRPKQIQAKSN